MASLPQPVHDYIVARLRRSRLEKGICVKDLPAICGIPVSTHHRVEGGKQRLSLEHLFSMTHGLGVGIEQIWPGKVSQAVEKVDQAFVQRELRLAEVRTPPPVRVEDIANAVCQACEVPPEELAGAEQRSRKYSEARLLVALLVKERPPLTMVEAGYRLGRVVSGLDMGVQRLRKRLDDDPAARRRLRRVRRRLEAILDRRAQQCEAEAEQLAAAWNDEPAGGRSSGEDARGGPGWLDRMAA